MSKKNPGATKGGKTRPSIRKAIKKLKKKIKK